MNEWKMNLFFYNCCIPHFSLWHLEYKFIFDPYSDAKDVVKLKDNNVSHIVAVYDNPAPVLKVSPINLVYDEMLFFYL